VQAVEVTASDTRPTVLLFAAYFLPGFKGGGPIRTLANLIDQLGETFRFRVVTSDRDLGDQEPYSGVVRDRWTKLGDTEIYYCSPGPAAWRRLLATSEAVRPDLIYLNSFFSPQWSIRPLVHRRLGAFGGAPVLLAPRGEFSCGALSLKPIKKRAFLAVARLARLHAGLTFQASSQHEADDIRRVFRLGVVSLAIDLGSRTKDGRIAIARNLSGSSQRPSAAMHPKGTGSLRLVFLARIAPMKNLLGALQILSRISDSALTFDIYGILEDPAYWARCQAAKADIPPNITIRYRGPLRPEQVEETLAEYDAFLFPTLGENYGHVIREALSAGLPVLISDRTPWRGLEAKGAGADLPLDDLDAFADRIRAWAALSPERFQSLRRAAQALGDDPDTGREALEANRRMILEALRTER
jgi:glycosyltransferase involved in cell wall biosynthesis